MNKAHSINGHTIIDAEGVIVAEWSYDHAEFARTGNIIHVDVVNGGEFWTNDLDVAVARW